MVYDVFSAYYDRLTENAEYEKRADYFCSLLSMCGVKSGILLDLACGTGTMSVLMAQKGFDVIGVDNSVGMLNIAHEKVKESGWDVLLLCSDMCSFELFGTVDCCICTLDSLNHLPDIEAVEQAFANVALFMNDGGIFAFDMNTPYKHREILGDNAFTYDFDGMFCAWQNEYDPENGSVDIYLDFFTENEDGTYTRESETFNEKSYGIEEIKAALDRAGFDTLAVYDDMTFNNINETAQRAVFAAKRRGRNNG